MRPRTVAALLVTWLVLLVLAVPPPATTPTTRPFRIPTLSPADERLAAKGEATWGAVQTAVGILPGESQAEWHARVGYPEQCDLTMGRIVKILVRNYVYKPVQLPPDACHDGTGLVEWGPGTRLYPGENGNVTVIRQGDRGTAVTSIGRVMNPDPSFDWLREALK
jgi:hypothetical protein